MPNITIAVGVVLIALGLLGYLVFGGDDPSVTALIPAFFGVPIVLLGALALKPGIRKHAMHAALFLGVLGFLAPLGRLVPVAIRGELQAAPSTFMLVAMALTCLAFVVLGIRTFVAARRTANPA